jgi:hypothetical protein
VLPAEALDRRVLLAEITEGVGTAASGVLLADLADVVDLADLTLLLLLRGRSASIPLSLSLALWLRGIERPPAAPDTAAVAVARLGANPTRWVTGWETVAWASEGAAGDERRGMLSELGMPLFEKLAWRGDTGSALAWTWLTVGAAGAGANMGELDGVPSSVLTPESWERGGVGGMFWRPKYAR